MQRESKRNILNKRHPARLVSSWLIALFGCLTALLPCHAQTADSLIVSQLRQEGVSFSQGNDVKLLMSGQEKFDSLFQDIRRAQHYVYLEYFNFRNDSIAMLLFDLLAEKAQQGVEVRALFDAFGNASNNQPLKRHHLKDLRRRGIKIYKFDPLRFPWINHVFSRDHRKIVVIDGQTAYTGGMNVADYYIKGTEQVGSWRDMHCRIKGPEVQTLEDIFNRIWQKTVKRKQGDKETKSQSDTLSNLTSPSTLHTPQDKSLDSLETKGCLVGIINREPRRSNRIIRTFYNSAINDAQDSIKLVNPYLTLNHRLKRNLRKAIKRGVKVEIMVSTRSDIPLTPDCMFYNVHRLMKRGAEIWMYEPGFHHTKIIMVDGRFCTVGSANLNARSLRWDYEENAVIVDHATTQQLSDMFDRDKRDSFRLTPETWNSFRTPWQKFRGWFAHLLAPFL